MADKQGLLAGEWERDDANRQDILERVRDCAALSDPTVEPPRNHQRDDELPENHQSLGSRGVLNMVGRLTMALYPPTYPWFRHELSPKLMFDPNIPVKEKQAVIQQLYLLDLTLLGLIESAGLKQPRRRYNGFRVAKNQAITQLVVTGDVLEYLDDNYRLWVYPRSTYVTKRDGTGDVLYHITRVLRDVLSMDDEDLGKCGIRREDYEGKSVEDRTLPLYTRCRWQQQTKTWLIEQEYGEVIFRESEEPVSPFFSTPFKLTSGEDYGRGFVEANFGDLRSYDALNRALLEHAAMASKALIGVDASSITKDDELAKSNGEIVTTEVRDGVAINIAPIQFANIPNFTVVMQSMEAKRRDLSLAFLLESDMVPDAERIPSRLIQRNAAQVNGILGGLYIPITDSQHIPLIRRVMHQAVADRSLPAALANVLKDDSIEVRSRTGAEALALAESEGAVMSLMQVVAQLPPEAAQKVDMGVLVDLLARMGRIQEPGLIKSEEQVMKERRQQMDEQVQLMAAQEQLKATGQAAVQETKNG